MFKIVDRYFLYEVSKVFGAVVGVLILITSSMLFLRTLEEVNVGGLTSDVVIRFLLMQIVRDMSSLLPPAAFLSVLIALGRMARDSELIALTASGMGPTRIYRSLLFFALPVAVICAWFALELQPYAAGEITMIRAQQKEQTSQIAGLQAGRFYQMEQGMVTIYVKSLEESRQLGNIFIHDARGDVEKLVLSDLGQFSTDQVSGDHIVKLIDGWRYDGNPGQLDYGIGQFSTYRLFIPARGERSQGRSKHSTMLTEELIGSVDPADRAELEHRIASPIAILTLTLMAIPLTAISPKQGTSGRMLLAFMAYFGFFNLQRLAETWLETGITPLWLGSLWYQALLLLLVYAALLPDSYWFKRIRRRLFGGSSKSQGSGVRSPDA